MLLGSLKLPLMMLKLMLMLAKTDAHDARLMLMAPGLDQCATSALCIRVAKLSTEVHCALASWTLGLSRPTVPEVPGMTTPAQPEAAAFARNQVAALHPTAFKQAAAAAAACMKRSLTSAES